MMDIAQIIEQCTSNPCSVSDDDYKKLRTVFDGLLNNSKCPCDSGMSYKLCCKPLWRLAERSMRNRDTSKDDRMSDGKPEGEFVEICRVGMKNGSPCLLPPAGKSGIESVLAIDVMQHCIRNMEYHVMRQIAVDAIREVKGRHIETKEKNKS